MSLVSSFFFSFFGLFLLYIVGGCSWLFSFEGFSFPFSIFDYLFEFDFVSLLALFMLVVCGFSSFIYCFHYFVDSVNGQLLYLLIVWFVGVMSFLVISRSLIVSLVFWEYLGIVSFLLILFYSNMSSLRASLVTLFSSRFGDVSFFCLICWFVVFGGSFMSYMFFLFFVLVVGSKSASFPFIAWLLEAMRAPTPVSSLVHSSTLVAAGVWFLLRYGELLSVNIFSGGCFFIFGLITIIVTGVCALCYVDLKKIVALSTCNNISWCLVFYFCGDIELVLFQLVCHGLCKCFLFMLVGDLMSSSGGSQSGVGVYMSSYSGVFSVCLLSFLVFSLCGLPFIGIFFTKHFFLSGLFCSGCSWVVLLLLFFGFFLSYAYSCRFCLLLCSSVSGLSCGVFSGYVFIWLSVLIGGLFNFVFVFGLEELLNLSVGVSVFFIIVMLSGLFVGWLFYSFDEFGSFWDSVLWGNYSLVGFFYYVFDSLYWVGVISLFRWELFLLKLVVPSVSSYRYSSGLFVFTMNFLVLGIFFCFVLFFLF